MVGETAPEPSAREALGQPGPSWHGVGALARRGRAASAPLGRESGTMASLGLELAPYPLRIAAFLADEVGRVVLVGMLLAVLGGVTGIHFLPAPGEAARLTLPPPGLAMSVVLTVLYRWVWNSRGWSPGKRLFGLRIVDASGEPPGLQRGLARAMWAVISETPFYAGYLWAGWDQERRTWHDRLAGTWVVRAERRADRGNEPDDELR